jgi:hypothetical protein
VPHRVGAVYSLRAVHPENSERPRLGEAIAGMLDMRYPLTPVFTASVWYRAALARVWQIS